MRIKFPREFYAPKGATKMQAKTCDAVVYLYVSNDGSRVGAVGFAGNAQKPAFKYTFRDEYQRTRYVTTFFENRREIELRTAANKAERKAEARGVEVGDVLRRVWGYDQTNVDYWEVTALVGKAMVEIRALAKGSVETQHMKGECVPLPGKYAGPPERHIAKGGRVKIDRHAWAYKIAPEIVAGVNVYKPDHWTAYA